MNAIDFSVTPPAFESNCEKDDLCWVICPQGAIEYLNPENMHYAMGEWRENHPFVKFLNEEMRWEGNEQIIHHLRMALVLHEARHLERLTERGKINPEEMPVGKDGHFIIKREEKEKKK